MRYTKAEIQAIINQGTLILDGGTGTYLQQHVTAEDMAAARGCNDYLCVMRPEIIRAMHEEYINAGADIIETNSFNGNYFSLSDFGLQDKVYEINKAAATVARQAAEGSNRQILVAGSVGPTNKTLSMSADVNNPGSHEVSFCEMYDTYKEQIKGLLDGGADIILLETVFDTLNTKAAIKAIIDINGERDITIPVMISLTISDASGRTLSGQTLEAFVASVKHADPISIGMNCGFGAKQLIPYLKRLRDVSPYPISLHPNAGLPNVMGGYDETPETFAENARMAFCQTHISIYGGCCGTTPEHIKGLSAALSSNDSNSSNSSSPSSEATVLSGLEPLTLDGTFISVGERTNVAGSAKFKKLIAAKDYDAALSVARQQVENGAQIIDVCMDDGMIDGVEAMTTFLRLIAAEPDIARVPLMIDSSRWDVIKAGLENVQGKAIVNSISLKEGVESFLAKARHIHAMGAAAVVMLFDEEGQADTYERKVAVARRAYTLLQEIGFPTQDIIFDPNVLAIATGMKEHNDYARAFIAACETIHQEMPEVHMSGGISNLSFSFRGNNPIRQAMHSIFLYHAMKAGLDMSIVNPAMTTIYSEIPHDMLQAIEPAILNTDDGAGERLLEYAQTVNDNHNANDNHNTNDDDKGAAASIKERISAAMLKGITDDITELTEKAYGECHSALSVIDNYLMPAMEQVGILFGEGKMFLPQVVKSARVMKKAVSVLEPYMNNDSSQNADGAPTIIFATVKGDVHDIGKNIAAVVTQCNGYNVIDLGVMVECDDIINSAIEHNADVIGLSGLITPSLDEMTKVVKELQRRGMTIPVIIGGATTSSLHTAVKIAPEYPSGIVIRSSSAAENATIVQRLLSDDREEYIAQQKKEQQQLRESYLRSEEQKPATLNLSESRHRRHEKKATEVAIPSAEALMPLDDTVAISKVKGLINWNMFFQAWGLKGDARNGEEGSKIKADAEQMLREMEIQKSVTLRVMAQILPAYSTQYDEIVITKDGKHYTLPMPRSMQDAPETQCLADHVMRQGTPDWICPFIVTAGIGLKDLQRTYNDDYRATMAKLLCDRLTEALAEYLQKRIGWGTTNIRLAFGYGACPDHKLKKNVFDILGIHTDGTTADMPLSLTETYMIIPGETICGLIFANTPTKYFNV